MGAVSKTQLALNYAEETRGCYNPAFWIDARTEETVQMSFQRIAAALGLTFLNSPTSDIEIQTLPVVAGMCRWFSERDEGDPRWLVIIDNADDTSWRIDEIIPRGTRGHVIVTSQHRQTPSFLGGSCKFVEAREMSREEARTLLKQQIRLAAGVENEQELDEVDGLCNEVADRLGCLALAVELAGLYLSDQLQQHDRNDTNVMRSEALCSVFRQYLPDFERHQDELLRGKPFLRLSFYQMTVWTVWDTSLAAIEKQVPQSHANQMLTFLAQFDRGQMEEEMFRLASGGWRDIISQVRFSDNGMPDWLQQMINHDNGRDDFYYRQATQPLMRYGLLRQSGGEWKATTMHSLVQWRARKAGEDSKAAWRRWTLLFLLAAVYQTNREMGRPSFRRHLIAHLLEMNIDYRNLVQEMHADEISTALLGGELGAVLSAQGHSQKAEELERQVVETTKRVLGAEHAFTLNSMHNLGHTLNSLGKYEEAEKIHRDVLQAREKAPGANHPFKLSSMDNLAMTLNGLGKIEEAEKMLREVLMLREKLQGKDDPDTLFCISNLAAVLSRLGKEEAAVKMLQEVLQAQQRVLGKEHPDTLRSMHNLAAVLLELGQNEEAMVMFQEAFATMEKVLGKEHLLTLITTTNLATALYNLEQYNEAKEMFEEVLPTMEKTLGKEYSATLRCIYDLAVALYKLELYDEAKKKWEEVLPAMEKVLGKEHPDTLKCTHWHEYLSTRHVEQKGRLTPSRASNGTRMEHEN
ncbi:uncharacterized protein A1O5_11630 [Cladophialophora psammophila CBS 110553]|uniref:Uncharacterized protein n=1 Tax=Cladophialophora psammophila CBS 110553 TaxID=1182543 RepID=W9WYI8_9EURO|nr:uncharacterized protein A1O5_11630 [Cladophialophora psammophila CBS 110553]EXJ63309.1 hypothetical protein A1O5_11630 [Cladophialophora psammophila CBS 110553]